MAETQEAPFTEADVQSFAAKLQEFSGTLTESEQAVLKTVLEPIIGADETSGYAYRAYGLTVTQYLSVNLGHVTFAPPVSAAYSSDPPPPAPYVPSLTYVDGVAYNDHA
jgi:hypothetical protein